MIVNFHSFNSSTNFYSVNKAPYPIASIALIFAAISVFISYKSLRDQRKHNIKSIRPILHVGQWDYENDLCFTDL
jgi:hypothetical protein